jgi:predicted transcriptional regulator
MINFLQKNIKNIITKMKKRNISTTDVVTDIDTITLTLDDQREKIENTLINTESSPGITSLLTQEEKKLEKIIKKLEKINEEIEALNINLLTQIDYALTESPSDLYSS